MNKLDLINTDDLHKLYNAKSHGSFIEMTYLRSNLCGHGAGKIDVRVKDIGKEEVVWVLVVVMGVVAKN